MTLFGDGPWLAARCKALGVHPTAVTVVDTGSVHEQIRNAAVPTPVGGARQLQALQQATRRVQSGTHGALVTAPMSKEAVTLSQPEQPFRGHTEWLAQAAGLPSDAVTMIFAGPRLLTGLVTTHVPVAALSQAITPARVQRTLDHLAQVALRLLPSGPVKLAVAGLNPHAGENGLLGTEELAVIAPAVQRAVQHSNAPWQGRVQVMGPLGAETAFRWAASGKVHGVVAMFHDQATIASKILDFGDAVNLTWGLPFIRTSVDHGVAYDAAKEGNADPAGMIAAVKLAAQLTTTTPTR